MTRRGVTFTEVLVVALILGLSLPAILTLMTAQEREVRHSAHQIDVASLAHGRLGQMEGRLAAGRYRRQLVEESCSFPLESGDHKVTVTERCRVVPMASRPGVFFLEVTCSWVEPYAGASASRNYAASLLIVDPELDLRNPPAGEGRTR